jgi:hypothetical protein
MIQVGSFAVPDPTDVVVAAIIAKYGYTLLKGTKGGQILAKIVNGRTMEVVGNEARAVYAEYKAGQAAQGAFAAAKAGGRHAGTIKNYAARPADELQKAVRGYEKQVNIHRDKIINPEDYVTDWGSLDPARQARLQQKWEEDMIRNKELAEIMRQMLCERGISP